MTTEWANHALGEICDVRKGTVITEKAATPGDVPVIAGGIGPTYFHSTANRGPGVTTVSASGANAGYVSHWDIPIFASDCTTVEPLDDAALDRRFLFRQLSWLEPRIRASLRKGAAQPHVYAKDLAKLALRVPPVAEQKRIAGVLDAADGVRVKRQQALDLFDSLTESIFLDMFGVPDPSWPTVTIESLASDDRHAIRTGPFGSQLLHSEFVDEGVAVLGIDNAVQDRFAWGRPRFITEEKFEQLRRYQVRPGDVLVTIMATCGRVAVVPDDIPRAINTKHLCCITLDRSKCSPWYLWAAFRFHSGLRGQLGATARGAVMPGLNMSLIKNAKVTLPPIEIQTEFVRALEGVEAASGLATKHASQLEELFASLQHRAFRGEL